MAQIADTSGLPEVTPQTGVPDDYQHIQASPAAFGGAIAQGVEKAGVGASKAGTFFGQVQTDDALNNAMGTANKALEHFKGLSGADALRAQDDTNAQIDGAFKEARDGLATPEQQYQFDQTARFFRERYVAGQVSSHANQQAHEFSLATNNAMYENGQKLIAANPDDPAAITQGMSQMHSGRLKNLALRGLDGDQTILGNEINQTKVDATEIRIKALAATNPVRALEVLDANRQALAVAPNYDAISNLVQERANFQKATGIVRDAKAAAGQNLGVLPAPGGAPVAPSTSGGQKLPLRDAILQQESGAAVLDTENAVGMKTPGNVDPWNRPILHNADGSYSTTSSISIGTDQGEVVIPTVINGKRLSTEEAKVHYRQTGEHLGIFDTAEHAEAYADALHNAQAAQYNSHGAPLVSANGAIGPAQITPGTFAQYAKPGERIDNPADNRAVGARIIDDLSQKFGNDPARVAVGYFSGPGNVAPAGSPTPWVSDLKDANGKSVSSYVSDVIKRVGPQSPAIAAKASGTDFILKATENDPKVQRIALTQWNEEVNAAQMAALQSAAARRDAQEGIAGKYVDAILKRSAPYEQFRTALANDPVLDASHKETINKMAEAELMSDYDKKSKDFGSGFWDAYKSVTAPEGTPGKIVDPFAIMRRAGPDGDLTLAGAKELNGIIESKKTVDGEAEVSMRKGAMDYAKQHLTFDGDFGILKDPKGMRAFNSQFVPAFWKAYAQGQAAGKSSFQMLSKDSPDYIVDKVLAPYKRTQAQLMADYASAGENAGGPAAPPANAEPTPPARTFDPKLQAIRDQVTAGKLTREQGIAQAVAAGLIAPPTPAAPMAK